MSCKRSNCNANSQPQPRNPILNALAKMFDDSEESAIQDLWSMIEFDPNARNVKLSPCKEEKLRTALSVDKTHFLDVISLGSDLVIHPWTLDESSCKPPQASAISGVHTLPESTDQDWFDWYSENPSSEHSSGVNTTGKSCTSCSKSPQRSMSQDARPSLRTSLMKSMSKGPMDGSGTGAANTTHDEKMASPDDVITPVVQESVECAMNATFDIDATFDPCNRSCNIRDANLVVTYEVDPNECLEVSVDKVLSGIVETAPVEIEVVVQPRQRGDCPSRIPIPVKKTGRASRQGGSRQPSGVGGKRSVSCGEPQGCTRNTRPSKIPVSKKPGGRTRTIRLNIPVAVERTHTSTRVIPKSKKTKRRC